MQSWTVLQALLSDLHSHKDIEEVILILDGQGEAWIDGEMVSFRKGDAVFFPAIQASSP